MGHTDDDIDQKVRAECAAQSLIGSSVGFAEAWDQEPLVARRLEGLPFRVSSEQLLTKLGEVPCPAALLQMLASDGEIAPKLYTRVIRGIGLASPSRVIDYEACLGLFQRGSTIYFSNLPELLPELSRVVYSLQNHWQHAIDLAAFLTPARSRGARPHADTVSVLMRQVEGSKRWTLYAPELERPIGSTSRRYADDVVSTGEPVLDIELEPGDALYVPRGFVHVGQAGAVASLHLSIGFRARPWCDLLVDTIRRAADSDPSLRADVPIGPLRRSRDIEDRIRWLLTELGKRQHLGTTIVGSE